MEYTVDPKYRHLSLLFTGGTAVDRNQARPGSGTFTVAGGDGEVLQATLDGWGVYSPEPARMASLVRRLASGTTQLQG